MTRFDTKLGRRYIVDMEYIPKIPTPTGGETNKMRLVGETVAYDQLTPAEAVFAHSYAEERNLALAFKEAYPMGGDLNRRTTWSRAREVFLRPHVHKRILELQDALHERTVAHLAMIAQDLHDIANADPNDLVRLERFNCRYCHGVDFKWQWLDAMECARALDKYRQDEVEFMSYDGPAKKGPTKPRKPADLSGGVGFTLKGEPHPACPSCYGQGYARTTVMDTTKLDPKTRKLYKGVKEKADGSIEILMHDQQQARDMLIKMLGGYKDGKVTDLSGRTDQPIPATATAEEAQRAYMRLISG